MPNLLAFDPTQYLGFAVIFARISGMMISAPLFGEGTIPVQVRVGLAFILSLVFVPVIATPNLPRNPAGPEIVLIMLAEVAVGVLIGATARLLMAGITMAGEIAGFQMGLAVANVFDPTSNTQVSLIGQFKSNLALLLLVAMDGHHIFIRALVTSYRAVPAGGLGLSDGMFYHFTAMAGNLFLVGLQIGAPLIVSLLAANFAIGLIGRSVPQINIIVVGFPFTIAMGLIIMALGIPYFIEAVTALLGQLEKLMLNNLGNG